jgi:hypothetical protein
MRAISKTVIVFLIIAALLLPALAVNAQGGTWSTGVNVQNLGTGEAHIRIKFYNPAGTLVYTHPPETEAAIAIAVGGVATIYVPSITGLDNGRYSAVVESDQPIAAVANNTDTIDQMGDSYLGSDPGATQVVAPLWYRNYRGYSTKFYAQNASATTQNITIALSKAGESLPAASKVYSVLPYAAQEIDLAADASFAALEGFYGSAAVVGASGDVALVVTTNRMQGTAATNFNTEYRGIRTSLAAKSLTAPLVYQTYNSWATGIMVVNTEAVAATVVVTYTASALYAANPTLVMVGSVALGPYASTSVYLPNSTMNGGVDLPVGFFGAAEMSSNTAILAIVNNTKNSGAGSVGSAYEAFAKSAATSKVAGPLVYRNHSGNDSGIQVQNLGSAATNITMVFTKSDLSSPVDSGGNPVTGPWTLTANNVPAGGVATFYLPGDAQLAGIRGLFGAVAIESSGGAPIVAVVNTTRYSAGISSNYVGINH